MPSFHAPGLCNQNRRLVCISSFFSFFLLLPSKLPGLVVAAANWVWEDLCEKSRSLLTGLSGIPDQRWRPHLCLHSTTASVRLTKSILFLGFTHWLHSLHHPPFAAAAAAAACTALAAECACLNTKRKKKVDIPGILSNVRELVNHLAKVNTSDLWNRVFVRLCLCKYLVGLGFFQP